MNKLKSGSCILDVLKQEKKFGLRFWRLHDRGKDMTNAFRGKKLTSKLCLVYLQVKLRQNKCASCN